MPLPEARIALKRVPASFDSLSFDSLSFDSFARPPTCPLRSRAQLDKIDEQIKKRRARLDEKPSLLYDEVMNLNAALVDGGHAFNTWTLHVLNSFATAEGRSSMMDSGLARRDDVARCDPREFERATAAALLRPAEEEGFGGPTISAQAKAVLFRSVHLGLVHAMKKHFESGLAARMRLAPGESGGRYRCVAPERLAMAGLPSLMTAAHIEELQRERIVFIDDVIPADLLKLAQAEALGMAAEGSMKGEPNATCNPGEYSVEMGLWEESSRANVAKNSPGLYHCIRSLWNLPGILSEALGKALRVPQTMLLASYPPGALYHRHLDSYDGKDIPRYLTVLLYLVWDPQRGGQLRALNSGPPDAPREPFDVEPRPGRLCVFFAQEIEHMVLKSEGNRFALTLWIWDTKKDARGR